jgi:hypothetical protein
MSICASTCKVCRYKMYEDCIFFGFTFVSNYAKLLPNLSRLETQGEWYGT